MKSVNMTVTRSVSSLAAIAICMLFFSCEFSQKKLSLPKAKTADGKVDAGETAPPSPSSTAEAQSSKTGEPPGNIALPDGVEPLTEQAPNGTEKKTTQAPSGIQEIPSVGPSDEPRREYRLSGAVTAPRRSVLTFKVGGFIEKTMAKPGDRLKAGDVLAMLEQQDYELRFKLASARRDQAKVALDTAEKDFKRERELKSARATTSMSFEKINAAFQASEINLKMAELDMSIGEKALNDTKLVAPYDCVVSQQFKYAGEQVGPSGGNVFEVYDTAATEISLSAPERLMGKIKNGDELTVTIPAIQYSEIAKVIRVVPSISNATRTFEVVAQFAKVDERVVPGHFAEAVVQVK